MAIKYKTNIEITSEAANKDEAMEIVGDYLSGNIMSGIDMKCTTKQVRFYNHTAARVSVILLLVTLGFLSGTKITPKDHVAISTCQMAAVQPPLKTSNVNKDAIEFKKEWGQRQTSEALNLIKK